MSTTTATVMMTDVVGSTDLRVRIGDSAANELVQLLELTTDDLVRSRNGRTIKHLGDGTLAVFNSAAEAMSAATEVVAAARAVGRRRSVDDLDLRVGLGIGDLEELRGDVHGIAVVVAARLCDRAPAGGVLAADTVALLAGDRFTGETAPEGQMELKGLPAPVAVVSVRPPEEAATGASRADRLAGLAPDRLVGRDREGSLLASAWGKEGPGLVKLAGEPGLGKTSLITSFGAELNRNGHQVLYGAAEPTPAGPIQPWPNALGSVLDSLPVSELMEAVAGHTESIGRIVPSVSTRLQLPEASANAGDFETQAALLADSIVAVLGALSKEHKALLVLDDMHWSSPDAAHLLSALWPRLTGINTLVVVSYRDTEVSGDHPMLGAFAQASRHLPVCEVLLEPLATSSVGELLESGMADLVDEIAARSGGNPFFALTLADHYRNAGSGDGSEPAPLQDLIAGRINDLGPNATEVLAAASLIGNEFDLDLLLDVVGDDESVIDLLDQAVEAGILKEGRLASTLGFSHGLIAETLAEALRPPRRARLHLKIADALEETDGSEVAIASHLIESGSSRVLERVVQAALAGSNELLEAYAHGEAESLLRRAVDYCDAVGRGDRPEVAPLLARLGLARYQIGDLEGRREVGQRLFAIAKDTDDSEMLRQAAIAIAGFPKAGIPDPAAEGAIRAALDATPDDAVGARAELLSMFAYYRSINGAEGAQADTMAREAVELARSTDSPEELAEALAARSFVLTGAPSIEAHLEVLDELESIVESLSLRVDQDRHEQYVLRQRGPLLLRRGDREGFEADLAALTTLAEERHHWLPAATAAMWSAMLALAEGRHDEAEADYAVMLAAGEHEPNYVNSYAAAMFTLRHTQGRAAELRSLAEEVVGASPEIVAFRPALALARLADGDRAGAESIYRELAGGDFAAIPSDFSETYALTYTVELCGLFGGADDAEILLRRLEPFGGQLLVVAWGIVVTGAADRCRGRLAGMLGRDEEAAALDARGRELEASVGIVEVGQPAGSAPQPSQG